MIATLALPALIESAARVGVELQHVNSGGNLYVWHTPDPEQAVVYIGKSASDKRLRNELGWRDSDPEKEIFSGIVTLLRVNQAELQALRYVPETFDTSKWRSIRDKDDWRGPALDRLDEALPVGGKLTVVEVETLLIRLAVRYGAPIGNSQFASQWETPIGTVPDTLAALAVYDDPSFVPAASENAPSRP